MKKFIIAAVVVFSSVAFTACTKENVAPRKASTLSVEQNKDQLGQGDFTDPNKDQLGQGDYDGNKDQLGQGDYTGGK